MTTIRRMRLAEAPVLRELTKEGVAREAARYPEDRIGISEAGLDNLGTHYRVGTAHPDLITLVAEDGGEIVGFVDAQVTRDRTLPGVSGEIGDLWVRDDADAEAAQALVREAVRELRERGGGGDLPHGGRGSSRARALGVARLHRRRRAVLALRRLIQ
jgi:ribosomal protein S18 acetylase RimI-like enzyme